MPLTLETHFTGTDSTTISVVGQEDIQESLGQIPTDNVSDKDEKDSEVL